jgi:hypothetical protein
MRVGEVAGRRAGEMAWPPGRRAGPQDRGDVVTRLGEMARAGAREIAGRVSEEER